ncbi:hypothetical protein EHP00_1090 [Ecytonucleospora hepatopenaei]|uniref:Uncharacterized protein n=1 Tax=Ecytonucleospora hepatopenaei TaxID=646526 RepID=A0A1W0E599_9MICR|nr:hypothetical protein EHP00_1090 [Ecytonucleospora hepatopenaei]
MPTAVFEIECEHPQVVLNAVNFGERDNVKYSLKDGKISLHFVSDNVRNLVKSTYSVCNKIQLSIDTIEKFKN